MKKSLCWTRGSRGLWTGIRGGSYSCTSQSICPSSSLHGCNDHLTHLVRLFLRDRRSSRLWLCSGHWIRHGSVSGICWVSRSAVSSGSLSAVGSGAGVETDAKWVWTLGMESSSTSPTVKEDPSTHKAKLIYSPRVQQESPFGITLPSESSHSDHS